MNENNINNNNNSDDSSIIYIMVGIDAQVLQDLGEKITLNASKIKTVRFTFCNPVDLGFFPWLLLVNALKNGRNLRRLEIDIYGLQMTFAESIAFVRLVKTKLTRLEWLELRNIKTGSSSFDRIGTLLNGSSISRLSISECNGITTLDQSVLFNYFHGNQTITHLRLDDLANLTSQRGLSKAFKAIFSLPLLRFLDIPECGINDETTMFDFMVQLAKPSCKLVRLNINKINLASTTLFATLMFGLGKNKTLVSVSARQALFESKISIFLFLEYLFINNNDAHDICNIRTLDLYHPLVFQDDDPLLSVDTVQTLITSMRQNNIRIYIDSFSHLDVASSFMPQNSVACQYGHDTRVFNKDATCTVDGLTTARVPDFLKDIDDEKIKKLEMVNCSLPDMMIPAEFVNMKKLKSLSLLNCNLAF